GSHASFLSLFSSRSMGGNSHAPFLTLYSSDPHEWDYQNYPLFNALKQIQGKPNVVPFCLKNCL
ncbi:hypothetical protein V7266_10455, partial [Neobacillus drentensis]|uniref:hypothetical protein n=1 Tax=Neobacillus drentensis TaxID=220684 RepID=UPI002FFFA110